MHSASSFLLTPFLNIHQPLTHTHTPTPTPTHPQTKKLTYDERKARVAEKKAKLAAAAGDMEE
jgi:hypothetical protein